MARAEIISTPVMLVLLLIVFGGLIAAGLPLIIAVVGVGRHVRRPVSRSAR